MFGFEDSLGMRSLLGLSEVWWCQWGPYLYIFSAVHPLFMHRYVRCHQRQTLGLVAQGTLFCYFLERRQRLIMSRRVQVSKGWKVWLYPTKCVNFGHKVIRAPADQGHHVFIDFTLLSEPWSHVNDTFLSFHISLLVSVQELETNNNLDFVSWTLSSVKDVLRKKWNIILPSCVADCGSELISFITANFICIVMYLFSGCASDWLTSHEHSV